MIDRLKEIIIKKFNTQANFAMKMEVSRQVVSSYLQGRAYPSINTLIKLGLEYDINLDWVLTGRGSMEVSNNDTNEVLKLKAQIEVLKDLIKKD